MSSTNHRRGRLGLLASTSFVAVSVTLLGVGFTVLTPGRAEAAIECGNPAANGAAADTFNCPSGVYPTGIVYPLTAGDLTLNLVEDAGGAVQTTTGGIQVLGLAGDDLTLARTLTTAGTGDPSIINGLGAGISFTSPDSNIAINLADVDGGDAAIVVTGSTSGIVATSGGAGNVSVTLSNGTVTGQAGDGVVASTGATGTATVALGGANVVASNTAVGMNAIGVGVQAGAGMTVTGSGAITATGDNYAFGIYAVGDGPIVVNQTGAITANGAYAWGVYALGTAGGTIDITTSSITVNQPGGALGGGDGISAYTTGAVTISSGTVNTTGVYADGIFVGGPGGIAGNTTIVSNAVTTTGAQSDGIDVGAHGVIDINSGSVTTTGANSNGIEADSDLSRVVIRSTSISATGAGSDGIHAAGATGVTITTGSITAGARGIDASSTTGNVLITGTGGTIRANAGDGIDATATLGSATVALGTTNVVSTNTGAGLNAYGVSVSGATGMTVTGSGSVTATGDNYAVGIIAAGDGPIVINETGTITATADYAWGVYAIGTNGGPINITTSNVVVNQPGGPAGGGDGILAYTTGAVTIASGSVSTTGNSANGIFVGGSALSPFGIAGATTITSGSITTTGPNSTGIRVGAHGPITITSGAITTTGTNSNGIQAATDLSTVNVTSNGAISATGAGSSGIVTISQTGTTVTANGNITAAAHAINTLQNGAGAATINVGAAATVRSAGTSNATAVIQTSTISGQTTTINNAGVIRSTNATVAGAAGDLALRGIGGNVTVNDSGRIDGRVDFSALTGTNRVAFNTTATGSWHVTGLSTFSAGNDTLTNAGLTATIGATILDFGADTGVAPRDVFNNSGRLVAGETAGASTLTITGLETFNNSGSVFFGSLNGTSSDGETNDRVVMSGTGGGTAFVGSGASTLFMDANLGVATQTGCAAATVADCLSLPGGTTSGSTKIRINNTNTGPGGLNTTGIVLVDATGGAIGAGSLVIDPASAGYVMRGGAGAIDTGFFNYRLVTLGTTQAALVSAPDSEVFEFAQFGAAATDAWYIANGTWFDRQADLRDSLATLGEGGRGAVWAKVVGDMTERTEEAEYSSLGTVFTYDTSFEQNTVALIGGVDFLGAADADSAWVIGAQIGYVDSDVNFNASNTLVSMEGMTVGAYGSWMAGPWYVDALVAGTFLDLEDSIPSLGVLATPITGSVDSVGAQIEAGWRMSLGESTYLESMASLAYVTTSFDELTVPGGTVEFEDVTSLRGSVGLRLATTMTYPTFRLQPSLYVRAWNEFDGEGGMILNNPGLPISADGDFSGAFADVGGQLNVYSEGGLTAFVNGGYKWKSDYNATTVNIGFRYQF